MIIYLRLLPFVFGTLVSLSYLITSVQSILTDSLRYDTHSVLTLSVVSVLAGAVAIMLNKHLLRWHYYSLLIVCLLLPVNSLLGLANCGVRCL